MVKQFCLLLVFMILFVQTVIGQNNNADQSKNHERIKAKKIAYITDALELTPSESEKFWPVYHEFKKAHEVLHNERHSHDKLDDISEAKAMELLERSIQRDKEEIRIKEKYNAELLKCIPAQKLVKLRGVERKFRKDMLSSIRDRYSSKNNRKN